MTVAVIDLGTNTFHLVIAEISFNEVKIIYKTNLPVKLGEGRINENIIIPEAFERGLLALEEFHKEIKKHNVALIRAIATSAIRSAGNGENFIKAAKSYAGIQIEVITGDQEAEYIFNGVKATGLITGTSLIMDIGGGSTEFIVCSSDGLLWKKSYNIGAARLMQAYFNSDPINEDNKLSIINHLDHELMDLKAACILYRPDRLIGSAGAFETFAAMLDKDMDLKEIKSAVIDLVLYKELSKTLISSTHAAREKMPDLIKLRVDMIVIAAILTDYIISACDIKDLSLSVYDLKMGVLYSLASEIQ